MSDDEEETGGEGGEGPEPYPYGVKITLSKN